MPNNNPPTTIGLESVEIMSEWVIQDKLSVRSFWTWIKLCPNRKQNSIKRNTEIGFGSQMRETFWHPTPTSKRGWCLFWHDIACCWGFTWMFPSSLPRSSLRFSCHLFPRRLSIHSLWFEFRTILTRAII